MITAIPAIGKPDFGSNIKPINVDQFHEMMRNGSIMEGAPVELIYGVVVPKDRRDTGSDLMAGPRHSSAVRKLNRLFTAADIRSAFPQTQQAVILSGDQELEPDASIILGDEDDFSERHPVPPEIAIAIEVADSSLRSDRTIKQAIYAAAGIPVYWIVNLVQDLLEVYTQPLPDEDRYGVKTIYRPGQTVTLELPTGQTLEFAVADFFPPVT